MRRAMSWMKSFFFRTLCIFCLLVLLVYIYNLNSNDDQSSKDHATIIKLEADVQKLLARLRQTESQDDLVLLYNRVPKTGSTSFAGIMYDLCARNGFTVIHLNVTKHGPTLSLADQNQTTPLEGEALEWSAYESNVGEGTSIVQGSKSASNSPPARSDKDIVIIYNRVPKTGSTTFANVLYTLCRLRDFTVIYVRAERNSHIYSITDQMRFVNNVTGWNEKKPAIYHGHLAYLDFEKFGSNQKPIYINILREPLDRLISYYYFLRHGDNFRPHLKRRKSNNKETFDECVQKNGHDCDPRNLWMQIPFFCGHAADCWVPGNPWALEMAKHNLVHNYLLVGVTEDMGDFVAVLEATLPRFFRGATDLYNTGQKSHLRKTANKTQPASETMKKMRQSDIYRMELEFYEFAKEQFDFIKYRTFEYKDGYLEERRQMFQYEKIKPS